LGINDLIVVIWLAAVYNKTNLASYNAIMSLFVSKQFKNCLYASA